ncbi:MAG: ethanolamine utilization protein EutN [Firmicutes bacterium]|nr:ethanolamine utilization protein EutN [Bacillota bacterium]
MHIGKVVGTVVATRKDENLTGCKLMITQPLDSFKKPIGNTIIAVDTVGAGIGEIVVYTKGTAARIGANRLDAPIDASIVAIVDNVDVYNDLLE